MILFCARGLLPDLSSSSYNIAVGDYRVNPCSFAVLAILSAYIACLSEANALPLERIVPKLNAAFLSIGVSILLTFAQFASANQN